jgi:hypothetical protein
MQEQLPSVFIGSSSEGLSVAREVELQLQLDAVPTIWKDGVFGLGSSTLESLMRVLNEFDFALMVLSPDDLSEVRGQNFAAPRDNVIFELGLFMGRLGRERVFVVHEQSANLKLPSDLAGIAIAPYRKRDDGNLSAALSPTCTLVIKAIKAQGLSGRRTQQQIRSLQDRQENTEARVRTMQMVMTSLVTKFEYEKLLHLEAPEEFLVSYHNSMVSELNRLDSMNFIRPRPGYGIESIRGRDGNGNKFDLKQYVEITEQGREYLSLRSKLTSDNMIG